MTSTTGENLRDPNTRSNDLISGSGIGAIRAGNSDITTGGGIIEVTQPDGTSLGRFMVGDDGVLGISGLTPGQYRITLVQPPRRFTNNQFNNNSRPVDANGNPFIDLTVNAGGNYVPNFNLIAEYGFDGRE